MNIPRALHTNSSVVVPIPDDAKKLRVDLARNHVSDRTLWPAQQDQATWSVEQNDGAGGWIFLGSSTTRGGEMVDENGYSETSWDETSLLPGIGREVRITLVAHQGPVDTFVTVKAK